MRLPMQRKLYYEIILCLQELFLCWREMFRF